MASILSCVVELVFALLLIVLLKVLVRNCSLVSNQIDKVFHFKHPVNAMVGLST